MSLLSKPHHVVAAAAVALIMAAAVPAAAQATPSAVSHHLAVRTATLDGSEVSSGGCTENIVTNLYISAFDYYTVKAWIDSPTCSTDGSPWVVEAGITCENSSGVSNNFWGSGDTSQGSGSASYAACDNSYPIFTGQNGGFRIDIGGTWYYHTDIY